VVDVKCCRLGDVADLIRGVSYKPSDLLSQGDSDSLPLLRATNIGGRVLELSDFVYVPAEFVRPDQLLKKFDIVIAMASGSKAAVGRLAQLRQNWTGGTGSFCAVIRAKDRLVEPEYLGYVTLSPEFRNRIETYAQGTAIMNLSHNDLMGFTLELPVLSDQRAIAGVLGALDDKIESNRRIWKTALQLISVARANAASVEVTHLKSLGQLADFNLNTTRPGPSEDKIVYIDIASVTPGSIEKRQVVTWGDAPSRARREVRDGDLIFSTVRPGRRSFAVILNPEPRTVVSTGFAVMTPKNCGTSFLAAVIADEEFADYCENVAQGSAYPAVSPEAMSRFEVEVPSVEALDKFESMYLPILRRGDRAQAENVILSNMRDALLPELLSGRLRVRDAEKVVEGAV